MLYRNRDDRIDVNNKELSSMLLTEFKSLQIWFNTFVLLSNVNLCGVVLRAQFEDHMEAIS